MTLRRSGPLPRHKPLVARSELTRTTELPRGGNLSRTPLTRSVPLPRAEGGKPRTPGKRPLPAQTAEQRRLAEEWAAIRAEAWEAYGQHCGVCRAPLPWEQCHGHHRQLKSGGGQNVLENCLPVSMTCHDAIHRGGTASYDAGLLVHPWDDPGFVVVRHDLLTDTKRCV